MRAVQFSSFGIDSLTFADRPTPVAQAGEVLLKIHAVSLNFRDLLMVKGLYNPKLPLPRIPCSDGAGEVVAVGTGVTAWKPGDRAAAIFMQNWIEGPPTVAKSRGALGGDIDGMLATHIVVKESGLVPLPPHLSYAQAATLPCAAVTAWNALAAGNLRPGSTALIQGTGGVSIFALQFALMQGLRVLGISSSDEKLGRAAKLGLSAGLNYRDHPDWERWVLEETGGEGADLIVDVGGGATLPRSVRAVRFGGVIAQVGVLSGIDQPLPIGQLLHRQARIQGIYVGSRSDFMAMNRAITQARLEPVFEAASWLQAVDAFKCMESAGHIGKLVLTIE